MVSVAKIQMGASLMWKAYCLYEVAERKMRGRALLRLVHMPSAGIYTRKMWPWKIKLQLKCLEKEVVHVFLSPKA